MAVIWSAARERFWAETALRANAKRFKKTYPNHNQPWRVAEDRRLLALYAKIKPVLVSAPCGQRVEWWQALARRFGRTDQAVRTRLWGLLGGARAVRATR